MKLATIGTGSIVDEFLQAVEQVETSKCVAMYSRKVETATALAEKYNIKSIYTSLEEMYQDPEIECVYIASPNSLHFDHAYQALSSGKHVICEKPFTSTVEEAEKLIALAKEKKLFLFDAISNIHLPNFKLIQENLALLGPIRFVQCNYSQYSRKYNQLLSGETPNVFNPAFSGGALLDINIYNLHFVTRLFGIPKEISYTANKHPNGIDTSGVLVMKYPEFISECVGSKDTQGMNFVLIQGENGYLHVKNGANGCRSVFIHTNDQEVNLNAQTSMNRLFYELAEFEGIVQREDYSSCYKLLEHTLEVVRETVKARTDAGIVFAADNG